MTSPSADRGSTFQREPEVTKDDADSHEAKKYRPTEETADNFPLSTCTAIIPVVGDSSDAVGRPCDQDILDQQVTGSPGYHRHLQHHSPTPHTNQHHTYLQPHYAPEGTPIPQTHVATTITYLCTSSSPQLLHKSTRADHVD
jgi:hypothetical protein